MKRFKIFFIVLCSVLAAKAQSIVFNNQVPKHEVRAVWLTTIGGIDWPHSYAQSSYSAEKQKKELTDILDRLQQAKINTVLIQTRVRGTMIYPSAYNLGMDVCQDFRAEVRAMMPCSLPSTNAISAVWNCMPGW